MKSELTDRKIQGLKPADHDQYLSDTTTGLRLRVTPSGKKIFQVRYRISGRRETLSLGKFPGLSLSDARKDALKIAHKVSNGIDPKIERAAKAAEREIEAARETIAHLVETWLTNYAHSRRSARSESPISKFQRP